LARELAGSCLVGVDIIFLADSFAGLIWRVDLPTNGGAPVARVWLQHESMMESSALDPLREFSEMCREELSALVKGIFEASTQVICLPKFAA